MKHFIRYMLIAPPLLICAAALCLSHRSPAQTFLNIPAAAEEERLQWLAMQGIQAEPLYSETVMIPSEFDEIYADYAALQEEQMLPLSEYAGKSVSSITYEITDSDPLMYAELLTADGILIGAQCYLPEEGVTLNMRGNPYNAVKGSGA